MDAGDLVPDEVIIGMIVERIGDDDARDGFLLDGFPRNTEQADALDEPLAALDRRLTAALLIEVPDEDVVRAPRRHGACASRTRATSTTSSSTRPSTRASATRTARG